MKKCEKQTRKCQRTTSNLTQTVPLSGDGMVYPDFPWSRYLSYSEMLEAWLDLERLFPDWITHEVLGQTYLGKNILLFKIGNPNGGRVWWNGTTHGGEVVGPEIYYRYARWLLENMEPGITDKIMLENYTLICPFTNADGYPSTAPLPYQKEGKRTNRNPTGAVNLNRNFPATWRTDLGHHDPAALDVQGNPTGHWVGEPTQNGLCSIAPYTYKGGYGTMWWCYKGGTDDWTDVPGHWSYRGSNPGSERETQAILYGLDKWKPKFLLDFHIWNNPWIGRSSLSDVTYCNAVIAKYRLLASARGVATFSYGTEGVNGAMCSNGPAVGATSFLLEAIGPNKDPNGNDLFDELGLYTTVDVAYLKFLPLAITFNGECAIPYVPTKKYRFKEWQDGDTNQTKIVQL